MTTVFVFPGLGDDERELAAFKEACAPTLRCIVVQFPDWTVLYTRALTLDQLVEHCHTQIQSLAPTGDLRLAGYSFGGTVAYAVAAAFTAAGRRVHRLGLIDAPANPHVSTTPLSLQGRWHRLAMAIRDHKLPGEIGGTIAGAVIRSRNARLLLALGRLRRFHLPFDMQDHLNKPITCRLREKLLLDLIERLQSPQVAIDVSTVLFRSTKQHVADAPADLGWSKLVRSLQIIHLQGDHHTVIKPENVAVLCKAFVEAIAEEKAAPPVPKKAVGEVAA